MTVIGYIIFLCSWWMHPIYVSFTNMDVNAEQGTIIASSKIFTDDLETVLHNKYNIDGWIGTSQEHPECRRLIVEYLKERFTIEINGNLPLKISADSTVIHEDALWIYFSAKASGSIKNMKIRNSLLTDFFFTQTNLMIINTGRKEKGYKMNRKEDTIDIKI